MNIQQTSVNLIKNIALVALFALCSCNEDKLIKIMPSQITLKTASGKILKTKLSVTPQQQTQGLSGTGDGEFKKDEAMLFFNIYTRMRNFWMPDTYFNLDIFFLDENFKIIDVDRNVKHHIGRNNFEKIPRAKAVKSRHVLELRADSEISKEIKIGQAISWLSKPSSQQIELKIRHDQSPQDAP
jgi:uncharacterized membrane protein (UPF0127 family)